ncbi:hypothetical protein TNCV_1962471 [Trichonephila clavipes]|nr:hypothetical protein TNCV_1962471 [Trichonephila clavipes]
MNYYNANNEDNINVKNNKGLDQISDSPEADLKRLFNPAMVVEDTIPRQTRATSADEGERILGRTWLVSPRSDVVFGNTRLRGKRSAMWSGRLRSFKSQKWGSVSRLTVKSPSFSKKFPLVRSFDEDDASVSLGQVTKFDLDAKGQVFHWHGSMQVAFQAEASFIDVRVGSAIFGGRDEVGMVHRVENHFLVFAILRNTGNEQFDKYTLATMVKQCSPFIYCWVT